MAPLNCPQRAESIWCLLGKPSVRALTPCGMVKLGAFGRRLDKRPGHGEVGLVPLYGFLLLGVVVHAFNLSIGKAEAEASLVYMF